MTTDAVVLGFLILAFVVLMSSLVWMISTIVSAWSKRRERQRTLSRTVHIYPPIVPILIDETNIYYSDPPPQLTISDSTGFSGFSGGDSGGGGATSSWGDSGSGCSADSGSSYDSGCSSGSDV